jgi:hypothetical protein
MLPPAFFALSGFSRSQAFFPHFAQMSKFMAKNEPLFIQNVQPIPAFSTFRQFTLKITPKKCRYFLKKSTPFRHFPHLSLSKCRSFARHSSQTKHWSLKPHGTKQGAISLKSHSEKHLPRQTRLIPTPRRMTNRSKR